MEHQRGEGAHEIICTKQDAGNANVNTIDTSTYPTKQTHYPIVPCKTQ